MSLVSYMDMYCETRSTILFRTICSCCCVLPPLKLVYTLARLQPINSGGLFGNGTYLAEDVSSLATPLFCKYPPLLMPTLARPPEGDRMFCSSKSCTFPMNLSLIHI